MTCSALTIESLYIPQLDVTVGDDSILPFSSGTGPLTLCATLYNTNTCGPTCCCLSSTVTYEYWPAGGVPTTVPFSPDPAVVFAEVGGGLEVCGGQYGTCTAAWEPPTTDEGTLYGGLLLLVNGSYSDEFFIWTEISPESGLGAVAAQELVRETKYLAFGVAGQNLRTRIYARPIGNAESRAAAPRLSLAVGRPRGHLQARTSDAQTFIDGGAEFHPHVDRFLEADETQAVLKIDWHGERAADICRVRVIQELAEGPQAGTVLESFTFHVRRKLRWSRR